MRTGIADAVGWCMAQPLDDAEKREAVARFRVFKTFFLAGGPDAREVADTYAAFRSVYRGAAQPLVDAPDTSANPASGAQWLARLETALREETGPAVWVDEAEREATERQTFDPRQGP
jgi:hypothetical protein